MRLVVQAKPGSARESVQWTEVEDGPLVVVRVRAKALDGAANAAVVSALVAALGLRRSEVRIVRGHRSRMKQVEVPLSAAEVRKKLCDAR